MGENVDNNQTRELFDLMYDIRDRTTRIETETKRLSIIEKKAEKADDKANEALLKSENNGKEISRVEQDGDERINKIESNIKWTWGLVVTIILGVAGMAIEIFIGG